MCYLNYIMLFNKLIERTFSGFGFGIGMSLSLCVFDNIKKLMANQMYNSKNNHSSIINTDTIIK